MNNEHHYSLTTEKIRIKHPLWLNGIFDRYRYQQNGIASSIVLTEGCVSLLEQTKCYPVFDEIVRQLAQNPTLLRCQQELKAVFWTIGLGKGQTISLTCKKRADSRIVILSETLSCPDSNNSIFIPGVTILTAAIYQKDVIGRNDWLVLLPREHCKSAPFPR